MRSATLAILLAGTVAAASAQQAATGARALVFDRVTVVDVEHGKLLANQRVVIAGNRIQAMGGASAVKLPKQAQVVNAQGKYLIPGLWDLHTHQENLTHLIYPLFIINGVTGIRDAASPMPLDTLVRIRREILAGTRVGPPRQILSGPIITEEAPCKRVRGQAGTCVTTGDTADARHLVDSLKAAGADMLKTNRFSSSMYFFFAAAARRAGLPFGGHTMVPARQASDSGVRLIDHTTVNGELADNCLYGETASIEACRPVAEGFQRNNTWWVPTWAEQPVAGRARTASIYKLFDEFMAKFWADSVPPGSLHDYLARAVGNDAPLDPSPFGSGMFSRRPVPSGGSTPDTAGYMYVARNAGLPIVAGVDEVLTREDVPLPGFGLHVELATYVAEDLTPLEALQTATLNPAKMLHATDSLGTVAPGKLADLVLLDANPLADILNTTLIRAVVANGRYFDRAALDQLLAEAKAKGNP